MNRTTGYARADPENRNLSDEEWDAVDEEWDAVDDAHHGYVLARSAARDARDAMAIAQAKLVDAQIDADAAYAEMARFAPKMNERQRNLYGVSA